MRMIPVRELLNRIRWDRGFGRGNSELDLEIDIMVVLPMVGAVT